MLITKNVIGAALLTLAVGVLPMSAQAAGVANASASISNLSYQLIDLNPTDGIAPSLTFTSFSSTSTSRWSSAYSDVGTDTLSGLGSTRIQGVNGVASTTVTRLGVASVAEATLPQSEFSLFSSEAEYVQQFSLSADTLVIFSATAKVSTTDVPGASITAQTRLAGYATADQPSVGNFSDSFRTYSAGTNDLVLFGSMQSFGQTMFGQVGMRTSTSAQVGSVPEPETYAMLLAGLGLVVGALRRQRRRAQ